MKINVTKSTLPSFEEYCEEIKDIWETHWLTNSGIKHVTLEKNLCEYLDVDNLTLFTNGHLALEAAIGLFNFPKGSEVITTPFTFVSTTNAIVRNGLVPVFCDINKEDFTIDVTKIEKLITDKTVAIVPVHVYGNICDIKKIEKIAKQYNLKVIYDAAHAFGVKFFKKGIGNFGDASMFSFHATKVFNTIEGGCITYNNHDYKRITESMKNFGIFDEEHCIYVGGNAKMNEFQASMGLCNLRHINEAILKRKELVFAYRKRLQSIPGLFLCNEQEGVEHNYSYFPIIFDGYKINRDQAKDLLKKHDIGTRKYFYPITSEFDSLKKYDKKNTPVAKYYSERVLTLPLFPDMSIADVDLICDILIKGE